MRPSPHGVPRAPGRRQGRSKLAWSFIGSPRLSDSRGARGKSFERGAGALGMQRVQRIQVRLSESGLVGQVAEKLTVLDECERIVLLLGGKALHGIG